MSELLVYERHPQYAAWFGRWADGFRLRQVRSLTQLRQALEERAPCVLCVEVSFDEIGEVAAIVYDVKRDATGPVAVIAMTHPDAKNHLLPLLQAGVDAFFESMLDRDRVSHLMRRAKLSENTDPRGGPSMENCVMSRLPWVRYASGGSVS